MASQASSVNRSERLTAACVGVGGRGGHLARAFAESPQFSVAIVCDVDSRRFPGIVSGVRDRQKKEPRTISDFRRALDDTAIDVVVVGTPDHWHAIPTILACQAGKHVYVEKLAGHNFREGQTMLAAARKHDRVVQVGLQSRSGRHFEEACAYVRGGALGKVLMAKGWESSLEEPVKGLADSSVPAGLDYDTWLGPAPERPFNARRVGNWEAFFDYGSGELGNDGVHRLDYARRLLEAGFEARGMKLPEWPSAVTASGGKYFFDDVREWPDTMVVTWDYPGATLLYEMRLWAPYTLDGEDEGAAVYGENGYLIIGNSDWKAFGPKGEIMASGSGTNADDEVRHLADFFKCIREGGRPTCDIAIGHVASSLIHMGNIAWRVDRKLHFDSHKEEFIGDAEANRYLSRTYRAPWTLPKV